MSARDGGRDWLLCLAMRSKQRERRADRFGDARGRVDANPGNGQGSGIVPLSAPHSFVLATLVDRIATLRWQTAVSWTRRAARQHAMNEPVPQPEMVTEHQAEMGSERQQQ